jgi:hypothetical protein
LLIGCYNSTSSSTCSDSWACGVYSLTTRWWIILTSSYKFEITITHGSSAIIEVVVLLRKLRVASNSLFYYFYLKILSSFAKGSCEVRGST